MPTFDLMFVMNPYHWVIAVSGRMLRVSLTRVELTNHQEQLCQPKETSDAITPLQSPIAIAEHEDE